MRYAAAMSGKGGKGGGGDAGDDGGLAYSDNIALAWTTLERDPDPTHLARVNAANEEFLRAVSVVGDAGGAFELPESAGVVAQEMARLDLKLNLLLDLVATLIYRQLDIPDTTPVSLSAYTVAWRGDVPAPGARVCLELYIQRGLPKPLCCYGEVISSDEEFSSGAARVRFTGLTGAARSWLEKFIFRQHRREIALRRSAVG